MPTGIYRRTRKHYAQILRASKAYADKARGKPLPKAVREKMSAAQLGRTREKSNAWKGEGAKYQAFHKWLNRHFKKDKCEDCGTKEVKQRIHFALKHGRAHSHERNDYLILCVKCHWKYDRKIRIEKLRRNRAGQFVKPFKINHG